MVHALHRAERETCGRVRNSCCETVDSNLHLPHFSRTTFISINRRTTPLCHRWPKHFGLTPAPRFIRRLKRLSNHFFTLLPKGFGVAWVHRVGSHSFADRGDRHIIWNYFAHMAVLAILSTDFISRSNYSGPHRSCGSLRNSFQLEGCFALGRKPLIRLLDRLLDVDGVQMAVQLCLDASRMYRRCAHAITSMTPVESNGEEDIRSLGAAVGDPWVVRCPHKVGIFKVDVGEAVPGRREIDQTPSLADKWRDTVDKHEVPQMIGAELRLEVVRGMGKRCGHDARVGDDHIEGFTLLEQSFGGSSHALQTGKIKRNELETSTIGFSVLSHLRGYRFGFLQVPRRAHN